jgi:hypothetical protein
MPGYDMKYHYTYTIHFVDGYYYHGRRTSDVPPEEDMYFGTPATHKDKWLDTMYWKVIENTYSTPEELAEAEYDLIGDKFKTDSMCLNEHNHKKFNMGGKNHTEESRQKMSEAHEGKKHSEETRQKLSEAKRGENHPFYGKKHSEEARQKMSEAKRGENSPFYGKNHSEETKQKISESRRGENHPFYGKKRTEETKQKMMMSNPNRKEVIIDGVTYSSINEAARSIRKSKTYIRNHYMELIL